MSPFERMEKVVVGPLHSKVVAGSVSGEATSEIALVFPGVS